MEKLGIKSPAAAAGAAGAAGDERPRPIIRVKPPEAERSGREQAAEASGWEKKHVQHSLMQKEVIIFATTK